MSELSEHTETLRTQAAFADRVLYTTGDMLTRFLAGEGTDPAEIDALRSQARAAMRALRTTNQLLAIAAQLHNQATQPQEAKSHERHPASHRLG